MWVKIADSKQHNKEGLHEVTVLIRMAMALLHLGGNVGHNRNIK